MRRLQQIGVLLVGFVVAGVMVALGWWQVQVFHTQGLEASEQRAAEAPVPLASVALAGAAVRDGYGRSVTVSGSYLADRQLAVPLDGEPGSSRVLTALRLSDGSVLAVVRGIVPGEPGGGALPTPPGGPQDQVGVLLPSEEVASTTTGPGVLDSVRIPALAQLWPERLIDGYLVLSASDARAQGLDPAPLVLPEGQGRLRNGAYAVQWWIFAAFAIVMAAKIAKDLGDRDEQSAGLVEHLS